MADALSYVRDFVGVRLDEIKGQFKTGAKITLLVRFDGYADRDFLMTDDEIPHVQEALNRRVVDGKQ